MLKYLGDVHKHSRLIKLEEDVKTGGAKREKIFFYYKSKKDTFMPTKAHYDKRGDSGVIKGHFYDKIGLLFRMIGAFFREKMELNSYK